jgi:hypothetical protein
MVDQLPLFPGFKPLIKHDGLCAECDLECYLRECFEQDGQSLKVSRCALREQKGLSHQIEKEKHE